MQQKHRRREGGDRRAGESPRDRIETRRSRDMDRDIDGVVAPEVFAVERVIEIEREIAHEPRPQRDPGGGGIPAERVQIADQRIAVEQERRREGIGVGEQPRHEERHEDRGIRMPRQRRRLARRFVKRRRGG